MKFEVTLHFFRAAHFLSLSADKAKLTYASTLSLFMIFARLNKSLMINPCKAHLINITMFPEPLSNYAHPIFT